VLGAEYYESIGHLVVAVSKLDSLLLDLISAVSGTDILSAIVLMGHQQTSSKADSLLALIRMRFGEKEDAAAVAEAVTAANVIADYRNGVVHAIVGNR
jgi:hypothetical protein